MDLSSTRRGRSRPRSTQLQGLLFNGASGSHPTQFCAPVHSAVIAASSLRDSWPPSCLISARILKTLCGFVGRPLLLKSTGIDGAAATTGWRAEPGPEQCEADHTLTVGPEKTVPVEAASGDRYVRRDTGRPALRDPVRGLQPVRGVRGLLWRRRASAPGMSRGR
ncbi:hypothetical protein NDU88_007846 [Pleurodeles waltl]|uniref:Uncharacterized protein n=1 Tax=Pleurodeles waltl TaxID=8319 RepID=A0AAV7LWV1_PLEWA|nr:hypothetical protein NDU88_007846 [Pleurodeles waltl]